jgi:DNA-directed RNA polymerase specialized sigma24 family protein
MHDEVSKLIFEHQHVIIRICRGFFTGQADREDLFREIVYKVLKSYGNRDISYHPSGRTVTDFDDCL